MKALARIFALALVGAGFFVTLHTPTHPATRLLALQAVGPQVPIPVCPPNDPKGCDIDKW